MKTPTVTVYKDVLYKILKDHNIRADEMSIRLGYNRNYLSATFSNGGGIRAEIPTAAVVAMSALLAVKQDDITAGPPKLKKEKPNVSTNFQDEDEITKIRCLVAEAAVTSDIMMNDIKRLDQTIKDAAQMLHQDMLALLKEWRLTPEPPKIGGDASK